MLRIQFEVLRKQQLSLRSQYEEAHELAIKLRMSMASDEIFSAIQKVHRLGGKSHEVQAILRRDLEILGFHNTGARADEAAQLEIADLDLSQAPERYQSSVEIHGKGNKLRRCPLWTILREIH